MRICDSRKDSAECGYPVIREVLAVYLYTVGLFASQFVQLVFVTAGHKTGGHTCESERTNTKTCNITAHLATESALVELTLADLYPGAYDVLR